ncbi:MAG: protease modulator HflC, partial [Oscillospiraceae bacterium]|nr:protease modulator HflC [Oscillospiraceae bacterium]
MDFNSSENEKKRIKRNSTIILIVLLLIVAIFIVLQSVHFVPEDEYAVQRRFDQVINIRGEAGLMFSVPFVDSVTWLPKNNQLYSPEPSTVLTLDKKAMDVDSYTIWRISNPMLYIERLNNLDMAQRRLDAIIYNATKNTLSALSQEEILAERAGMLDSTILEVSIPQMEYYGIRLLTVTIKQFALPEDNLNAVYTRMISERDQIAAQYRAEGQEAANVVRNTADKDTQVIVAEAKANSAKILAEGESEYMRILSDAYSGEDRAEFYKFMRSIDALKATMKGQTSIILPYDSPLGKWFVGYETATSTDVEAAPDTATATDTATTDTVTTVAAASDASAPNAAASDTAAPGEATATGAAASDASASDASAPDASAPDAS